MLKLQNIVKIYDSGANAVHALKGVSIDFRPCEFVAVLGHSGCGKTTLLNIIGGLDQYTSGDLFIRGRSTKNFRDRDWDTYRNHSIGFVFQSYNLIPHQSVLSNVELALTLSGVSRKERKQRAEAALQKVGLGDQLHKRPNQLSGGQMQRVAIARALVNDPEILLADEPTGALDSETSVQVMDLLQEIARDRLVIMVTHNPELAEKYATRTVRLRDGLIVSDSDPYDGKDEVYAAPKTKKGKKTSMSFLTALSLSLNNLMTKKGRTIMTAFAGSIGIIGIALILSLSSGMQNYITSVEKDTLSSYPISLQSDAMDTESMMTTMMRNQEQEAPTHDMENIYSNNIVTGMIDMMLSESKKNDLAEFKTYIESGESGLEALTTDISYSYDTPLNIYKADTTEGVTQVNPSQVMEIMGMPTSGYSAMAMEQNPMMARSQVWKQLVGDNDLLSKQYEVLAGRLPESWNEVVVIVSADNEITDFALYSLGLLDPQELQDALERKMAGDEVSLDTERKVYAYEDFLNLSFKLLPNTALFEQQGETWVDQSKNEAYLKRQLESAETIHVVGVLRPGQDANISNVYGSVGYSRELMEHLLAQVEASQAIAQQKADPETDIFTGLPFKSDEEAEPAPMTMEEVLAYIQTLPEGDQQQAMASIAQMQEMGMSDGEIAARFSQQLGPQSSAATYDGNLALLGAADPASPSAILLYPVDFEAKDGIEEIISKYNEGKEETDQITYTDYVGVMMSSITTIINAISYVLIAFVAISLVVSSIMIGIITNISVLERTKEIGILRAVGASKRDISRVFNAETLIIGCGAGIFGIGLTLLLIIPINAIIQNLAKISAAAALPPVAAVILVAISMLLTFIAGSFPARGAAKKDPVVALRTE